MALADTVAAAAVLCQGLVAYAAPARTLRLFGLKESAVNQWLMRTIGTTLVSIGVTGMSLLAFHSSINRAIGLCYLVWNAELGRILLAKEASQYGFDAKGIFAWFVFDLIVSHACLTDAGARATTVCKASGIATMLALSIVAVFPRGGTRMYGFQNMAQDSLMIARALGTWTFAYGVMVYSLASGIAEVTSLGYTFIPAVLCSASLLFITQETKTLALPKRPHYVLLVTNSVAAASALLLG